MRKEEKSFTEFWASVTSLLLLIFTFTFFYAYIEQERQRQERIERHKEHISYCLADLVKDCERKCKVFIEDDTLFVSKECKGKKLKSAWLSTSLVKAYYDGKVLKWIEAN